MRKLKLFCLPYAGGSTVTYLKWKKLINRNIEVIGVELPGRGRRINEPLIDNMEDMVEDIFHLIKDQLTEDYAIFGHSMGGLITYELCQRLKNKGYMDPVHIIISAKRAPHIKISSDHYYHNLPFDNFVNKIMKYQGMDKQIFENKELADVFVPILRSDFKLVETYNYRQSNPKLDYDFSILYGTEDDTVKWNELVQWDTVIGGNTTYYPISGGHFFINDNTTQVTNLVHRILVNVLQGNSAIENEGVRG